MDVFFVGLMTLLACTAVFYVVLFGFIYYWHLKKISFVIVPALFAFQFFWKGFLVVAVVSILFYFFPQIINSMGL
jgi:hypothetical protein